MRFVFAAVTCLLGLLAFAFVSAEAIEPNSCAVEGNVVSIEKISENASRVVFETTSSVNDSGMPCLFHANEEVTAVYERTRWTCETGSCPHPAFIDLLDLREGDSFTALLSAFGDEWNQTNWLNDVNIRNPSCAVLEGCGVDCGESGLVKNSRGCCECACSTLPVVPSEKFFRFAFAVGWNYFSYPLGIERYAFCAPGKDCLQKTDFLPRIVATDCDAESVLWRWADGGKTYSEYQFPDFAKKESVSFAGELFAGYWFKASAPCSVTIAGEEVPQSRLDGKQLFKGWNSLGAPLVPTLFDDVKGDCVVEKGPYEWNAAIQKFVKSEQPRIAAALWPGKAYFVKVKRDCWLSVQG